MHNLIGKKVRVVIESGSMLKLTGRLYPVTNTAMWEIRIDDLNYYRFPLSKIEQIDTVDFISVETNPDIDYNTIIYLK